MGLDARDCRVEVTDLYPEVLTLGCDARHSLVVIWVPRTAFSTRGCSVTSSPLCRSDA
jgi:hypothetical protein